MYVYCLLPIGYNEETIKEALKEGKVSLRIIKCLCHGPARVGKTHLKSLLLGIKIDSHTTPSTPCVEQAQQVVNIRGVTAGKYCQTSEGKSWQLMDEEKLLQLLAEELKKLM